MTDHAMAINQDSPPRKRPRVWPMPTRGSQLFESLFMYFPFGIALIGIVVALTLPLIQSCRNWARDHAGQAPPLNVDERVAP